ncbi:MAG: alpha/beta hydrolase [Rhodospirillaceae bacterium]|nr:alpha/beta hydrolase [Rhodospirillaceae bacterium]
MNYTQAELNRAYDQRAWAANAEQVIASYGTVSREVQARFAHTTHRYGPSEDEVLDLFPPVAGTGGGAPIHVFVHGGAWRSLTKDESAFPAPTFVENGVIFVALNFSVLPKVRLPDMIAQCVRAVLWVREHARDFGGDPERLYLSGHSSGGHIAGVLLTTDWSAHGLAKSPFRAGICASGMYDLGPVLLSSRSTYVKLDKAEEEALSPMRHLDRVQCPIAVAYGDGESPEFKRHARDFAAALKAKVRPASMLVEAKGMDHFEIALTLGQADGVLGKIALEQIFGRKG